MVTPYQFVNIRNRLSGHCLDVAGQNTSPGSKVVTWEKNGQKNQVWYYDASNWTIRTALNEFCLDYNPGNNCLMINPFNPGSPWQQWEISQNVIKSRSNPYQVVDLLQGNVNPGAQVGVSQYHGNSNQQWDFDAVGGSASAGAGYAGGSIGVSTGGSIGVSTGGSIGVSTGGSIAMPQVQWSKKEFLIKSVMDSKVIDIKGNNPAPNTPICMYNINKQKNQLWYTDQSGFIRSSLNDFVFYHDDAGQSLKMVPYSNTPKHQWSISGDKIVNGSGNCLDIKGGRCTNGSELCAYTFKNKENQRWVIQYL